MSELHQNRDFAGRVSSDLRIFLCDLVENPDDVQIRLLRGADGVLHCAQSPHRECGDDLDIVAVTLAELDSQELCLQGASVSELVASLADRNLGRDAELLAEINEVAQNLDFTQIGREASSVAGLVRLGFEFLSLVVETGPLFFAANTTKSELARESLAKAVQLAHSRIRHAHALTLGDQVTLQRLKDYATQMHGVATSDESVTIALGSGMTLLEMAFGADNAIWSDLSAGERPDGVDFATVLQVAFAPASINGQVVVDVPHWVATTLRVLSRATVLSDAYDDLSPVVRDTAIRLWTSDRNDEFFLFDRCVEVARKLDDH